MKKIIFILAMLFCPSLFAATLTTNTVPYVCQGGSTPQLCNSNMTTDSSGNLLSGSMFIPNNIHVFTSSGTWTKPAGVSKVYVKVIGGGGNGGNGDTSPGGGGGGYAEGVIAVTGNITVTIGTTNSFAGVTTIQATSGSGGTAGIGSNGTINLSGQNGFNSYGVSGGNGGNSIMGLGGLGTNYAGGNGGQYGGGGAGGGHTSAGGTGDPGAVIVYY